MSTSHSPKEMPQQAQGFHTEDCWIETAQRCALRRCIYRRSILGRSRAAGKDSGDRPFLGATIASRLAGLVGKQENGAGEIGLQRFFAIVASQDAVFPDEEVGVFVREEVPIGCGTSGHALADQEKVSVSDGLVVETRLAASCREALQCGAKSVQGLQRRIVRKIGKGEAHVVDMMKGI